LLVYTVKIQVGRLRLAILLFKKFISVT